MLMDSLVTVSIGIIKGIGKQALATLAYFICFYLIGVPASYYFCFVRAYGLLGLWIGLASGLSILLLSLTMIINKADWLLIAAQAKQNFLKETTLFYRASTLLPLNENLLKLEASTTHRKNPLAGGGSSAASSDNEEEEERSSSICLTEHHLKPAEEAFKVQVPRHYRQIALAAVPSTRSNEGCELGALKA